MAQLLRRLWRGIFKKSDIWKDLRRRNGFFIMSKKPYVFSCTLNSRKVIVLCDLFKLINISRHFTLSLFKRLKIMRFLVLEYFVKVEIPRSMIPTKLTPRRFEFLGPLFAQPFWNRRFDRCEHLSLLFFLCSQLSQLENSFFSVISFLHSNHVRIFFFFLID